MNCQDISRIVDAGAFSRLGGAERLAAEAHARTCRRCAPMWAVHSRVAELRVSPMPAELVARCQAVADLRVRIGASPALHRFTLVGGVVALAAAAAVSTGWLAGEQDDERLPGPAAAQQESSVATTDANTDPAPELTLPEVPVVRGTGVELAVPEKKEEAPAGLPLIPMPPRPDHAAQQDLALMKAVERHPELVEGPVRDGAIAVGMTMRTDGTVISSIARATTPATFRDIRAEVDRTVPRDSGAFSVSRRKDSPLPDGRFLRADVSMWVARVGSGYEMARSDVRVRQIIGNKYADYMRPATGSEQYRLTVLLSDDGNIVREKLESQNAARQATEPAGRTLRASDPDDVAELAQVIADRLEIDPEQIGLIGGTALEEGSNAMVLDEFGNSRSDDRRSLLTVYYAWQRRAGEAGLRWGQGAADSPGSGINLDNALTIVEREIPDAFIRRDRAAGSPVVVLTARGELIRAGRVHEEGNGPTERRLQDQLVPRVQMGYFQSVRLTDKAGTTVDVLFAWERPMAEAVVTTQP